MPDHRPAELVVFEILASSRHRRLIQINSVVLSHAADAAAVRKGHIFRLGALFIDGRDIRNRRLTQNLIQDLSIVEIGFPPP